MCSRRILLCDMSLSNAALLFVFFLECTSFGVDGGLPYTPGVLPTQECTRFDGTWVPRFGRRKDDVGVLWPVTKQGNLHPSTITSVVVTDAELTIVQEEDDSTTKKHSLDNPPSVSLWVQADVVASTPLLLTNTGNTGNRDQPPMYTRVGAMIPPGEYNSNHQRATTQVPARTTTTRASVARVSQQSVWFMSILDPINVSNGEDNSTNTVQRFALRSQLAISDNSDAGGVTVAILQDPLWGVIEEQVESLSETATTSEDLHWSNGVIDREELHFDETGGVVVFTRWVTFRHYPLIAFVSAWKLPTTGTVVDETSEGIVPVGVLEIHIQVLHEAIAKHNAGNRDLPLVGVFPFYTDRVVIATPWSLSVGDLVPVVDAFTSHGDRKLSTVAVVSVSPGEVSAPLDQHAQLTYIVRVLSDRCPGTAGRHNKNDVTYRLLPHEVFVKDSVVYILAEMCSGALMLQRWCLDSSRLVVFPQTLVALAPWRKHKLTRRSVVDSTTTPTTTGEPSWRAVCVGDSPWKVGDSQEKNQGQATWWLPVRFATTPSHAVVLLSGPEGAWLRTLLYPPTSSIFVPDLGLEMGHVTIPSTHGSLSSKNSQRDTGNMESTTERPRQPATPQTNITVAFIISIVVAALFVMHVVSKCKSRRRYNGGVNLVAVPTNNSTRDGAHTQAVQILENSKQDVHTVFDSFQNPHRKIT